MLKIDAGDIDGRKKYRALIDDQGAYAICLVIGAAAGALAECADSVTTGRPWRRVVWDNGFNLLDPATQTAYFGQHPDASGVVLDGGSGNGDLRQPAAWLGPNDSAYRIDLAFRKAESRGAADRA
jgi:hypothetical protein